VLGAIKALARGETASPASPEFPHKRALAMPRNDCGSVWRAACLMYNVKPQQVGPSSGHFHRITAPLKIKHGWGPPK
jgi:hypothetical protein